MMNTADPSSDRSGTDLALFMPSLGGGGAERAMLELGSALQQLGYRVDIVVGDARGPLVSAVSGSLRLVDLHRRRISSSAWALLRYLRHRRPAVLLSTLEHANVLALIIAPFARPTRIAIREATTASLNIDRSVRGRVLLAAMRRLYPRATRVIAVSNGVADELRTLIRVPDSLVRVIPNPSITKQLLDRASSKPDHPWFQDSDTPVILAAGRLVHAKGFDTLICAFAKLRQQLPCRLVIVGEGPLRSELEGLARHLAVKAFVDLPGFVPDPWPLMAHADAFVLPSRFEGLPNALIQALALGAPVVATDCRSGPREILDGGRFGRLVPVDDHEALADAIHATLLAGATPVPSTWVDQYRSDRVAAQYAEALGLPTRRGPDV